VLSEDTDFFDFHKSLAISNPRSLTKTFTAREPLSSTFRQRSLQLLRDIYFLHGNGGVVRKALALHMQSGFLQLMSETWPMGSIIPAIGRKMAELRIQGAFQACYLGRSLFAALGVKAGFYERESTRFARRIAHLLPSHPPGNSS